MPYQYFNGFIILQTDYMLRFIKQLVNQFIDDRCPQTAASLAYTSLLALVPLTIVIYKIFSSGIILPEWGQLLEQFVFNNFTPAVADQVHNFIIDSAIQADGLNFAGILMLLVSVLVMMYTIDKAINNIWRIHRPRHIFRRISVYLLILVFGPIAMASSLFISTYLASLPLISQFMEISIIESDIVQWIPFIVSLVAFTSLYKWVPDVPVSSKHALVGGVIAAVLFDIAKYGFSVYVNSVSSYKLIYGALAAMPLLLIWIYLVWLIVLIGAEISHSLLVFNKKDIAENTGF